MIYIDRHEKILTLLSIEREVQVHELAEMFEVSEVTIRKDLNTLEKLGCLIRTRGGARIAEDFRLIRTIDVRQREQVQAKAIIAARAKNLIKQGDTIYLDSGSTCLQLARLIRDMDIHVVTNSLDIMAEFSGDGQVTLSAVGGNYRKESGSFIGPSATAVMQGYQFSICFIGATGFSELGIFSSQNTLESDIKRQALANSETRIILADSEKAGTRAFSIFARHTDVDILITDKLFPGSGRLQETGIKILLPQCPDE